MAVIQALLNGVSIEKTVQLLEDDFHCSDIHKDTVRRMRLKVMYAISTIPAQKLSGVIQFDDTFFRENQKGTRNLVSPFPADFAMEREPRYGRIPAKLGVKGNEFITITCGIDTTGHAICKVLGAGAIKPDVMYDYIKENTDGIAYACSDADKTYREVFKTMNVPHYVKPSNYLDRITKAGYEQPSKVNTELAAEQAALNDEILEELWENGKIDKVLNRGDMDYAEFVSIKKENELSLGRVNQLHAELKLQLEKGTNGVSSKFLPLYVAWFQYVHNKQIDDGVKMSSKKMAEAILLDAISTRKNITSAELRDMGERPLSFPVASRSYMIELNKKTEMMKKATGDKWFQFNEEDGLNTFNIRKIMRDMPMTNLKDIARSYRIKYASKMSRSELISNLEGRAHIAEKVMSVVIDRQQHEAEKKARSEERKANKHSNRIARASEFSPRMFADKLPNGVKIVFLDTETTGLNIQYDEVLSLGVVDLDGEVLYDGLFKPRHKKHWREAQAINGISPQKVARKPHIMDEKQVIQEVLDGADMICGWNVSFDLRMLSAAGIDLPKGDRKYVDLMSVFAEAWSVRTGEKTSRKMKLAEACKLLSVKHKKAHTAVGDSAVLIPIAEWLMAA